MRFPPPIEVGGFHRTKLTMDLDVRNNRENWLRADWGDLCKDIGVENPTIVEESFNKLWKRYEATPRFYHTLWGHIFDSLNALDTASIRLSFPQAVRFAIYCHDADYVPFADDNEANSANFASELLDFMQPEIKKFGDGFVQRVVQSLIMCTKPSFHLADKLPDHAYLFPASIGDVKAVLDADLSVFGAPFDIFWQYEVGIFRECVEIGKLPLVHYVVGRLGFLSKLEGKGLFRTRAFSDSFEESAENNIKTLKKKLVESLEIKNLHVEKDVYK